MDAPERTTMTIQGVEYVVIRADLFTALEQELELPPRWQRVSEYNKELWLENERLRAAIRGVARHGGWLFWWYEDENEYGVAINVNDVFVPAADCENVDWLDVPEVIRIADESGYDGLVEWVRNRRALADEKLSFDEGGHYCGPACKDGCILADKGE